MLETAIPVDGAQLSPEQQRLLGTHKTLDDCLSRFWHSDALKRMGPDEFGHELATAVKRLFVHGMLLLQRGNQLISFGLRDLWHSMLSDGGPALGSTRRAPNLRDVELRIHGLADDFELEGVHYYKDAFARSVWHWMHAMMLHRCDRPEGIAAPAMQRDCEAQYEQSLGMLQESVEFMFDYILSAPKAAQPGAAPTRKRKRGKRGGRKNRKRSRAD
jgi:hypothetical protein